MPPETSILKAGRTELERALQPATPGHMQWCLNKLFVLPTRDGAAVTTAFQADNFIDACGAFPDDLWSAATLEILQTKTFRPVPAEMVEAIGSRFRERQRMLERVNVMLGGQAAIEAPKPFTPEPEADRLRHLRDSLKRVGKHGRAAMYEGKLAKIEGRTPEAWSLDPQADEAAIAEPENLPTLPLSPASQAALDKARAEFWRKQGRTAMADRIEAEARDLAPERFGEHRDVPEVA